MKSNVAKIIVNSQSWYKSVSVADVGREVLLPAAPESLDESRMEDKASTASTVVDDNYENKSIWTFILNPSVEFTNLLNCEGVTYPILASGSLVTWAPIALITLLGNCFKLKHLDAAQKWVLGRSQLRCGYE